MILKNNFHGNTFTKMVSQTKSTHGPDSAQSPSLFNFQFMGYIYQTSECLPSQGCVTVSSGSLEKTYTLSLYSILEVTGGCPGFELPPHETLCDVGPHPSLSPQILLYWDSALGPALAVYFIACCENLKETNTWKLLGRLLIFLDRANIYENVVCVL